MTVFSTLSDIKMVGKNPLILIRDYRLYGHNKHTLTQNQTQSTCAQLGMTYAKDNCVANL